MPRSASLPSACALCGSDRGIRAEAVWRCAVCGWRVGDLPDADLAPPRLDVVYYLRRGDAVKIGTTASPRQRFAAIPHDEVLALEQGDRSVERARHREFADDRLGTSEWFALSRGLRRHIRGLGGTPWEHYARWVSEAHALRGQRE